MFRVGDKVKTLPVTSYTDEANRLLANRDAVVTAIHFPFGLHMQYEIEFVEPFFDHGYEVKKHYYYDFDNGLEAVNMSISKDNNEIYRSPGVNTGLGFVVGGGYRGLTQELDDIVKKEAELLQNHFKMNVVIRFNSNQRSGGAWVVDSQVESFGANDSIGLCARLYNKKFASLSAAQKAALSDEEWKEYNLSPDAICFETAINIKKTLHSVPEDSVFLNYNKEYEFRDFESLEEATKYLFSHVIGLKDKNMGSLDAQIQSASLRAAKSHGPFIHSKEKVQNR